MIPQLWCYNRKGDRRLKEKWYNIKFWSHRRRKEIEASTHLYQHYRRNHIPAFGSWDCNEDLPFTQCFESARQAGLIRYSGDRDRYVAGDLYENNIVTPAIIVRRGYSKKTKKDVWVEHDGDAKTCVNVATQPPHVKQKAVDEDLYKISPELLRQKPRRKRWGLFCSCIM